MRINSEVLPLPSEESQEYKIKKQCFGSGSVGSFPFLVKVLSGPNNGFKIKPENKNFLVKYLILSIKIFLQF
jgi:hypothetical protein